jgi:23S rRNA (adenine2503-C2)-methyltransferase
VNDSLENAKELAKVLKNIPSKINLIPFNPFPGSTYKRPSNMRVQTFKKIMQKEGFITTVRTTRGEDIMAACGQLVGKVNDKTKKKERLDKKRNQIAAKTLS